MQDSIKERGEIHDKFKECLWQSEQQVDEAVSRLKDDKEIVKAMQAHLQFKKYVLKQIPRDKKLFFFFNEIRWRQVQKTNNSRTQDKHA